MEKRFLSRKTPKNVIWHLQLWKKARCPYASKKRVPEQQSSVRYLWFKCVLQLHVLRDHVWNMTSSSHTDRYKSISWWKHSDPDTMTFILFSASKVKHFMNHWPDRKIISFSSHALKENYWIISTVFYHCPGWNVERAQRLVGCVTPKCFDRVQQCLKAIYRQRIWLELPVLCL